MRVRIIPGKARGEITPPASKSAAHRLLLCAGLCPETSRIVAPGTSDDVLATLACLQTLGAKIHYADDAVQITGFDPFEKQRNGRTLLCGESASTMRFLLPIALLGSSTVRLQGTGSLLGRSMEPYRGLCRKQGLVFQYTDDGVEVCGPLQPGEFRLPGNCSSQFVSGLLFALPLLAEDSYIRLTSPLESRPYVHMTINALLSAGILIKTVASGDFFIPGGQHYRPIFSTVEKDWSSAAFLDALNVLGGKVVLKWLSESTGQADKIYPAYYAAVRDGAPTLPMQDCPDLAPMIMALAAANNGAVLTGTARLRLKESGRGEAMAAELRKCGAQISVEENRIAVRPGPLHQPTEILCGHNDHRIVMALAILATRYGGVISDAQAVQKSYPGFWRDLQRLGIRVQAEPG